MPLLRSFKTKNMPRREGLGAINGIFESVEEALASAPNDRCLGWDDAETADQAVAACRPILMGEKAQLQSFEYPALFWFSKILAEAPEPFDVVEFGGTLGMRWIQYQRLIDTTKVARWTVMELPAMVSAGNSIVREFSIQKLSFSVNPTIGHNAFMFASGSIQYSGLDVLFSAFVDKPPKHIILNRIPVSDRSFVTLQNGFKTYLAMRVFEETSLLHRFFDTGYRVVDRWEEQFDAGVTLPEQPVWHIGYFLSLQ